MSGPVGSAPGRGGGLAAGGGLTAGDGLAAGEPEIVVLPDPAAVSEAAAERIANALSEAVARRGRADWATTGGSTPGAIYRVLASPAMRDRIPWRAVHVWWGDDRFVPYDHPLSNVMPLEEILVAREARAGLSGTGDSGADVEAGREPGVDLPPGNIHPFPTTATIADGKGPAVCAVRYAAELRAGGVEVVDGWPSFDVFLIGVGPDGHVLSVFPDSQAWEREEWALGVPAPTHVEPHVPRVTLHPRTLDVARLLLAVVHGSSKAAILGELFGERRDERRLPAQVARRTGAVWLLDEAAAAELGPSVTVHRPR